MSETTYAGWPLIEIYGVGPDGKTCQCARGAKCGKSAGKHPRARYVDDELLNWADPANLTEISTWRPRANVGVLTGKPSGFFVIDVDPEGMQPMRDLVEQHGALPTTRRHRTGRGTFH